MGWLSREARAGRRDRKDLLRARTDLIVEMVFEAAPRWGSVSIDDLATKAARIAEGDPAVLAEIYYHPRVKQVRQIMSKDPPLIGSSKFTNHQVGMARFAMGFHCDATVVRAFEAYCEAHQALPGSND